MTKVSSKGRGPQEQQRLGVMPADALTLFITGLQDGKWSPRSGLGKSAQDKKLPQSLPPTSWFSKENTRAEGR